MTLPSSVDLMPEVEEIEYQGSVGSCTAHAVTTAVEIIDNRTGSKEKLSPQFNYDVTRAGEQRHGLYGAFLKDAIETGMQYGFCLESEYPYINSEVTRTPPDTCYKSAAARKISTVEAFPLPSPRTGIGYWEGVENAKKILAEGLPIVVAMRIYDTFFDIKGPLSKQRYLSYGVDYVDNHAVVLTGYDDSYSSFTFANSMGTEWGDGGFGRLPYGSFSDILEAWVIRGYRDITIEAPMPVIEPPSPTPKPVEVPKVEVSPKPVPAPEPVPVKKKSNYAAFIAAATILIIALIHFGGVLAEKFNTQTPSRIENER